MKFTSINFVYIISCFIVNAESSTERNENRPSCSCEHERQAQLLLQPSPRLAKHRHNNPFKARNAPTSRYDDMTPEEREERINRGFARIMQFMTFLGHVDNYLTDKASGLIKVMGRAIETDEEEDETDDYNRIRRHHKSA